MVALRKKCPTEGNPGRNAGEIFFVEAKKNYELLRTILFNNGSFDESFLHRQRASKLEIQAIQIRPTYFLWAEKLLSECDCKKNEKKAEDLSWDRPFVDTGQGANVPVLSVAENSHFIAPSESWEHFLTYRFRYLIAGGLAGAATRTITHPFDRARTTMILFGHEDKFKSMSSTFRTFWTEQGKPSLWRGLDVSLARMIPEIAIRFTVYEDIKQRLRDRHEASKDGRRHATFNDRFLAGAAAGLVSHGATFPLTVVGTRMAKQRPWKGEFSGIIDALRKLHTEHGIFGFYRGFYVSLCSYVPHLGFDFAFYGYFKKLYKRTFHTEGIHPPSWVLLLCGATSCTLTHLVLYPLVLPRIRIQAAEPAALKIQTLDETVGSYLKKILKAEGLRGWYRGLTPSLMKVVPSITLSFYFYETLNSYLTSFIGS